MQKNTPHNQVRKAGDKFYNLGLKLTAKSFYGESGIEYRSAHKAKVSNRPGSRIIVRNEEYNGHGDIKHSVVY